MDGGDGGKEGIVLFPFMGQGHMIPFLALALHIEQITNSNFLIYFVNTPSNVNKLKSSLPPNSNSIHFLQIPLPSSSHGLPPDSENSDSLPYHLVVRLLRASASLEFKSSFEQAILNLTPPPLCIISDFFLGWTATLAKQLGIYHAIFSASAAFGLACYYSLWLHLPHHNLPAADEFSLVDFEEASIVLHKTQLPANIAEADGEDDWSVFQRENFSAWEDSNLLLFNTLEEFDQIGLSYFKRKFPGVDVRAIGPLVLGLRTRDRIGSTAGLVTREAVLKWLDSKAPSSVLYVCFGSMNTISSSQMMELGKSLEGSGKNFIWVVRPPIEAADINSEFLAGEWLPEGFEERNVIGTGRGLIVEKWAPQVEILSHRAVSGFLSHCGWNSAVEALSHGVPMMGWALAGEQFFNVKLLEEMGVCVEVARGKKCEVKTEDIMRQIELVMDGNEKGKELKRKAEEVKEKIHRASTGFSVKTVHDFLTVAKLKHRASK